MLDWLYQLKQIQFLNNSLYDFCLAVLVLVGLLLFLKITQISVVSYLKKLSRKTKTDFDDVLIKVFSQVKPPFYVLLALFFAIKPIALPEIVIKVINVLFVLFLAFEIIRSLEKVIEYTIKKRGALKKDEAGLSRSMAQLIKVGARIILWLLAASIILSNLGFDVTSLVAGLGIGGLAVALAVQNILGDLFSSFSLYLDKPFQEGDFIAAGKDMGTVKKIGLKTTRIKTLQGEELVIPNKELTGSRVQNFKRMKTRRDSFMLGVVYGTRSEKLKKIPELIKKIIESVELAEFDRCHFKEYGDFSLNFEIVYFVQSNEYPVFMDTKQEINLKIYKKFQEEGIEFAYPTQTIFTQQPS